MPIRIPVAARLCLLSCGSGVHRCEGRRCRSGPVRTRSGIFGLVAVAVRTARMVLRRGVQAGSACAEQHQHFLRAADALAGAGQVQDDLQLVLAIQLVDARQAAGSA